MNGKNVTSAFVQPKSIFQTNQPRDTKTKIHILLVLFSFMTSFIVAIIFAETSSHRFPLAAERTLLKEMENSAKDFKPN